MTKKWRPKLEFGDAAGFVFLDEIQRKVNAGLYFKGLFDQGAPYKFIVSGSGSMELREKIHESLVGRKIRTCIIDLNNINYFEIQVDN